MHWNAEENPFTAAFRIASGMVIGLIITTLIQVYVYQTTGMDLVRDGMVAGSFIGMLTTLGRST